MLNNATQSAEQTNRALGGATEMNAKQTQRKEANAKRKEADAKRREAKYRRKVLELVRDHTVYFVRSRLEKEVEVGKPSVCLDLTDIAHETLSELEEDHPKLKDMNLFMYVEKWTEMETYRFMYERWYEFDFPSTLLTFSLAECQQPRDC